MDLEKIFWELCEQANQAELASDDCASYEPFLVEILKLADGNPGERQTFVDCFKSLTNCENPTPVPAPLVPFCMRALRYPEILELTLNLLSGPRTMSYVRCMNCWSDIIHAYEDVVWKDADIFNYYANELSSASRPADAN